MKYYYLIGISLDDGTAVDIFGALTRKECAEEKRLTDYSYEYKKIRIIETAYTTPMAQILREFK